MHPDFGAGLYQGSTIGIPYVVVSGNKFVKVAFTAYGDESDPGPMPIPKTAPIEGYPNPGSGDRHVLVLDRDNCWLYELFGAHVLKSAIEYKSVAEAIADCSLVVGTTAVRHRELLHPLKTLAMGAPLIRKKLVHRNVALLFGTEKFGLSTDDLTHCDWLLRIPTSGNISMNLGQAVAVCLYELSRDGVKARSREKIESATAGQMERLTAMLFEALTESGYVKPRTEASTEQKLRRMLRRLHISAEDAEVLQGMLRQISWKIGGAGRNRTDA